MLNSLELLKEIKIWFGKLTRGELFHQDNVPAQKSTVAMVALQECGFELVQHVPYLPNLATSD